MNADDEIAVLVREMNAIFQMGRVIGQIVG
jgi:hypothetical protein